MTVGPFAPAGVELRPTCTDRLGGRVSLPGPYGTTGPLFPPEAKHTLEIPSTRLAGKMARGRPPRAVLFLAQTCRSQHSQATTAYSENCIDEISRALHDSRLLPAMPPSSLEERVQDLCAQAIAAKSLGDLDRLLPQLQAAIRDHLRYVRSPSRQFLRRSAGTATLQIRGLREQHQKSYGITNATLQRLGL